MIKMLAVEDDEENQTEKEKAEEQQRHENNFKEFGMILRNELMKSKRWGKRDDYPNFSDIPSSMARESRRIFKVENQLIYRMKQ